MKYWDRSVTLNQGCSHVSESCLNCWSASLYHRFHGNDELCQDGKWTGNIRIREDRLPELSKGRKPRVIQIWNDTYHEQVPDDFLYQAYSFMLYPPNKTNHTYLVLTKRAKRMSEFLINLCTEMKSEIPDNVFHGTTCENQQRADERIPYLLQVPGKRWLSVEPILSNIILPNECKGNIRGIVAGAETGHHARKAELQWFRNLRNQCLDMGIHFFLKQVDAKRNRILDGRTYDELPWC